VVPENDPETAAMNLSPFGGKKHTPTLTQNQSDTAKLAA
jgi:hypothetical protein